MHISALYYFENPLFLLESAYVMTSSLSIYVDVHKKDSLNCTGTYFPKTVDLKVFLKMSIVQDRVSYWPVDIFFRTIISPTFNMNFLAYYNIDIGLPQMTRS